MLVQLPITEPGYFLYVIPGYWQGLLCSLLVSPASPTIGQQMPVCRQGAAALTALLLTAQNGLRLRLTLCGINGKSVSIAFEWNILKTFW